MKSCPMRIPEGAEKPLPTNGTNSCPSRESAMILRMNGAAGVSSNDMIGPHACSSAYLMTNGS